MPESAIKIQQTHSIIGELYAPILAFLDEKPPVPSVENE